MSVHTIVIIWVVKIFLYSSSVYSCHLFLISSASVRSITFGPFWAHFCMKCSLGISNYLEEISILSHSVVFLYFFALITEEGFLISKASPNQYILPFLWIWSEATFLCDLPLFLLHMNHLCRLQSYSQEWDLRACISRDLPDNGWSRSGMSHQGLCSTRINLLAESCTHPEFYHHCVLLMLPAPRMSAPCIFSCWNS